ncbi:MAG: proline dehydrogenase family protein [Bacteroidota bacterium]
MEATPLTKTLDFDDTKLAFAHHSDADLKRTYRLFRMIDSPLLTRIGPPLVTFALRIGLPMEKLIRRTIFDIFCGGTSLPDTAERSDALHSAGVYTILDYSVEGEKSEKGFDATRDEIIATIDHGARHEAVAFSAMKVTGIAHFDYLAKNDTQQTLTEAERTSLLRAKARMEAIGQRAFDLQQPVFVDAEESWIQRTVDRWTEEMMERFNHGKAVVYHTVQLYRHDRLEYLRELIARAEEKGYLLGVKLVRGAYLEKENDRAQERGYSTPMQPDKASTDRDYDAAVRLCLDHIDRVAICAGTHNAESSRILADLMLERGLSPKHPHVLFAQLLGMSDNISFNLAHHGYNVAKYLPYGPVKAVLPYLFRRADENTAIAGQSSREVKLLRREVQRRRQSARR